MNYLQLYEENGFKQFKSRLNTKTAIVLGCSGQDGSLISKSLLEQGKRVIGLARSKQVQINNHVKLGIDKDIEIKWGDINSEKTIQYLIEHYQPDSIFNLAAQSSVGKSFSEPTETLQSIISGTLNILEIARKTKYKGHIFFAGSSEMFGNTEKAADIEHQQNPMSPYGIAKQTSFNLVKLYRTIFQVNCVTGILFNHESHLRDEDFVIPKIIKSALQIKKYNSKNKIKFGNIKIIRDWGWAPEYVEAIQLITNSKKLNDHVICSGKANSLEAFITKVFENLNLNWEEHIEIDKNLFRAQEIPKSYGNPNYLFNELGWKSKENIDTIIHKLMQHFTE